METQPSWREYRKYRGILNSTLQAVESLRPTGLPAPHITDYPLAKAFDWTPHNPDEAGMMARRAGLNDD